ncbi:xylan 1,4-beta-xylosidase [Clostridium amylolyticum]|uniref:Xylan 1,4-beta-xylosidase n=1 Tax=Clostridium amylolyticum TaxID=1121298 RepID=A0A1M6H947_9CLOT|nr:helix-turn-helix domain-containing protein [Clostridium amylolyticum]SHJ18724.1 xylan 1,4-beta-xylosidase [Clostridium amylolyticum]
MSYKYEFVMGDEELPLKAIIHSVNEFNLHWHNKFEILIVLEGSVNVSIGKENYVLYEEDVILINSNEIHATSRNEDKNILLALQIDPEFYISCYSKFKNMKFHNKPINEKGYDGDNLNILKQYIANVVWCLNKKNNGYKLVVGSYLLLLGEYLINNFKYALLEDRDEITDGDLIRIKNIIDYTNENIGRNITLKEIAENMHLSYHFLSHFIKEKIGMSFQEYLNSIRLNKAVKLLSKDDQSITSIAYASGFPSVNSFNRLFKKYYNYSPSEYRDNLLSSKSKDDNVLQVNNEIGSYLEVDRNAALKKLYGYLKVSPREAKEDYSHGEDLKLISIDLNQEGQDFSHYWKKIITFGRASEGLRSNLQGQFRELQREIGFEYVRFHGIFMDEMMIYNVSLEGKVEYNWSYVDNLFDFFKEINIKPFIELTFMPSELKRTEDTIFFWKGNISPPRDINLWTDLVKAFVKHCINRYGVKEVETWYFEIWNEPELKYVFWAGSDEEYFEFYKETTKAIKSILGKLKVGGPSITHGAILGSTYIDRFLDYCSKEGIVIDFISLHIYPEYLLLDAIDESILEQLDDEDKLNLIPLVKKIYHGENNTFNTLNTVNNKILEILNYKPEIHVTEWNASSSNGNLIHDTSYVAAFIIKNVLQCIGNTNSLGYWTFTDLMEEQKLGISSFHGGFGLINKEGLKKASYYGYYLLSKLGDSIIKRGEDYIVTKKDDSIQILAYNYAFFDELFLHGDVSALTHKDRYSIYENKPLKEIEFTLNGLEGDYKITSYKLNREHGSVYDEWIKLGAQENMNFEEISYLQGISKPKMEIRELELYGEYRDKINIPVHGAELIILEKRI